ncbi:MAG: AAA family ATPase [Acidimicrobiales bacterium]
MRHLRELRGDRGRPVVRPARARCGVEQRCRRHRDLLAKVSLGTPGNAKVYILDEVHMLTRKRENALLKTLEEPPAHVIWVLATTEPHKVVQTIRSRCQVFELSLLGADEMAEHVRWVIADAGLDVDGAVVDYVVSVGGGSARDTLSALDRVVAAGGVVELDESTDLLLSALADRQAGVALAAVEGALGRGRDPRTIGEAVLAGVRDAFLAAMGAPSPRHTLGAAAGRRPRRPHVARDHDPGARAARDGARRHAPGPDPRVDLEVALVRLCPCRCRPVHRGRDRTARTTRSRCGAAPSSNPRLPSRRLCGRLDTVGDGTAAAAASDPQRRRAGAGTFGRAGRGGASGPRRLRRPIRVGGDGCAVVRRPGVVPVDDLAALMPSSPREVVELAAARLGIDKGTVVARANELLGPTSGSRSPDELARLWGSLVTEYGQGGAEPDRSPQAPDPADVASEGEADDIRLDELVDAPAHTDQMIERLTEVFPGAEVQTPEESPS